MSCKETLRKTVKQLKSAYTPEVLERMSDDIMERLASHPAFAASKVVLLFYSLPDEPNTHQFVTRWASEKIILLPKVSGNVLELRRYTGESDMSTGAFGIKEPTGKSWRDYTSIDLAVIPGVAFDNDGNRLGRGKGYYDRLLSAPEFDHVYKMGICFDFQKMQNVPHEDTDVQMDFVL